MDLCGFAVFQFSMDLCAFSYVMKLVKVRTYVSYLPHSTNLKYDKGIFDSSFFRSNTVKVQNLLLGISITYYGY